MSLPDNVTPINPQWVTCAVCGKTRNSLYHMTTHPVMQGREDVHEFVYPQVIEPKRNVLVTLFVCSTFGVFLAVAGAFILRWALGF